MWIPITVAFTLKKVYRRHQAFQMIVASQAFFIWGVSLLLIFKNLLISGDKVVPLSLTGFKSYNSFIYFCIFMTLCGSFLYFRSCLKNGEFRKENVENNVKRSQMKYLTPSMITIIVGGIVFSLSKIDSIGGNSIFMCLMAFPLSLFFINASVGLLLISYCKKRFPDFIIDYNLKEIK